MNIQLEHRPAVATGIALCTVYNNESYTLSNFRFVLFVRAGGSLGTFRFNGNFIITGMILVGNSFTVLIALFNMESIPLCVSLLGPVRLESGGKHNWSSSNANGPKSSQYSVNPGIIARSGRHIWPVLIRPMVCIGAVENQVFMLNVSGVS